MRTRLPKSIRLLSAIALLLVVWSIARGAEATTGRIVVLGFDGADARLTERWMDDGKLPNLAKLRAEGSYAPLLPTNPAQTPVSWSSFATGINPGRTEIFDFLERSKGSYTPTIGMIDEMPKPVLWGRANPLVLGGIAAAVVAFLSILVFRFLSARRALRLGLPVLVATIAFAVVFDVVHRYFPREQPWAVNKRKGDTFWGVAATRGTKAEIFRVPATFPAEPMGTGKMLSGLGVPDIRGTLGRPAYYTSDSSASLGENEFSLELVHLPARSGVLETKIIGPYNKPFFDYVVKRATKEIVDKTKREERRRGLERELKARGIPQVLELPMRLTTSAGSLKISVAGGKEIVLAPGGWSDWVELRFPVNPLVDRLAPVRGIAKFQLFSLEPELRLWLSPINFDPRFHPVPYTYPADFSETLFGEFGFYKTIGWTEDTWSLPSDVGDEQHFLDDMNATLDKDEEMMLALLARRESRVFVQVFSFTDRIAHLFWRFLDRAHPLYDAEKAARYAPEVEKAYRRMDAIVGKVRGLLAPDDLLMVCSDHGFTSYRRGVNYNTWLIKNGLMFLKEEETGARTLEDLFDRGGAPLFGNVDWSRTKAYALGLGNIYINLHGREPKGIVQPGEEYRAVVRTIKDGLEGLVDEKTGEHPVSRVYRRDEIYRGYDPALIPDLRVANGEGYRVSWQTTLGAAPPELIEDNLKAWSGDHCSNEPALVKGVLFSSRRLARNDPSILDIAPSILALLGMPATQEMDGKNLFAAGP